MGGTFNNIGIFLINTIFSLYILAIMLRFFLQWVKADFYNPICQFLIKVTNPLLIPLRRIIPGFFGLDCAAIILMLALQTINLILIALMVGYPIMYYIIVVAIIKLLILTVHLFFFAILINAVLSWVSPNPHNPMVALMNQLTYPILKPIRKVMPVIAGFDLSPLVALILLQVISMLLRGVIG